jgi:hypothetical protein
MAGITGMNKFNLIVYEDVTFGVTIKLKFENLKIWVGNNTK